jgi:two-component system, LytTR family, response regulator
MQKNQYSTKLTAIIVDDSPQARRLLKLMISEYLPNIDLVAEAENPNQAFELIKNTSPDLVLLDIEMPEKSGLELAEELLEQKINCEIIFTTAYNTYAIQAFRLSAIDYLLKPIQEKELIAAIEKVQHNKILKNDQKRLQTLANNLRGDAGQTLCLPILNGYEYLAIQEIEYLEANGAYSTIFLISGKKILISKNLKHFETLLESFEQFLRVHRSFLVNKNHIKSIKNLDNGDKILMQSSQEIDLARDRKKDFFKAMTTK